MLAGGVVSVLVRGFFLDLTGRFWAGGTHTVGLGLALMSCIYDCSERSQVAGGMVSGFSTSICLIHSIAIFFLLNPFSKPNAP